MKLTGTFLVFPALVFVVRIMQMSQLTTTDRSLTSGRTTVRQTVFSMPPTPRIPEVDENGVPKDPKRWEEVVDNMPHFKHEHQYEPGTMGYAAEAMSDAVAGAMGYLARRASSKTLSRRSSEVESPNERSSNRAALARARKAFGHKKKDNVPSLRDESSSELNAV